MRYNNTLQHCIVSKHYRCIYRAFLNKTTKQYFYYDIEGVAVYCYTKKLVGGEERHVEIKPLIIPDSLIISNIDSIQR